MANPDSTNTAELPAFTVLKGHQRRAVILRYEGKTYAQIANNINDEFALDYAERTVGEWFMAGGVLEQAYHELLDLMAKQSLQEARSALKLGAKAAANTLLKKLTSNDEKVQVRAAMAILNKYIPDKQVVMDAPETEDDLPEELSKIADEIATGGTDGPKPVDDTPQGEGDNSQPGPTGGEAVS